MFLSRCGSRYYLFYTDDLGRRRKISTRTRRKAEALQFLQAFKQQEHERKSNLKRVSLSAFTATFLEHSRAIHTRKTAESNATALAEFQRSSEIYPFTR